MQHRERHHGFTLIEILIVIGIIALLAVALLPNIVGASKKAEIAETSSRVNMVVSIAEAFERVGKHGYYPPDDFVAPDFTEKPKINGINTGIESFLFYTHVKKQGINGTVEDKTDWLTNTDGDDGGVPIVLLGTTKLQEISDKWGTPLAYFNHTNYEKAQRIKRADGEEVTARAMKNKATGAWLNPQKFQVISAGPDFEFGTEDDVTYPEQPK